MDLIEAIKKHGKKRNGYLGLYLKVRWYMYHTPNFDCTATISYQYKFEKGVRVDLFADSNREAEKVQKGLNELNVPYNRYSKCFSVPEMFVDKLKNFHIVGSKEEKEFSNQLFAQNWEEGMEIH